MMRGKFIILTLWLFLAACGDATNSTALTGMPVPNAPQRVSDNAVLSLGQDVYRENCAACHGPNAEGAANWRKRNALGAYPAPPLNGSGHAWHHSTRVLTSVILEGSQDGRQTAKTKMPAWRGVLSDAEVKAVIVWFQSLWPQPVYDAWFEIQERGQ